MDSSKAFYLVLVIALISGWMAKPRPRPRQRPDIAVTSGVSTVPSPISGGPVTTAPSAGIFQGMKARIRNSSTVAAILQHEDGVKPSLLSSADPAENTDMGPNLKRLEELQEQRELILLSSSQLESEEQEIQNRLKRDCAPDEVRTVCDKSTQESCEVLYYPRTRSCYLLVTSQQRNAQRTAEIKNQSLEINDEIAHLEEIEEMN